METKALFLIFEHTPDGWRYASLINSPYSYPQIEAERIARNMSAVMPTRLYSVQHGGESSPYFWMGNDSRLLPTTKQRNKPPFIAVYRDRINPQCPYAR